MMKLLKRGLRISLLLAAIAAAGFCIYFLSAAGTRATFPDGTRVQLLGVSVGTNSFSWEPWWHPLTRRLLPARGPIQVPPKFVSGPHGFANGISVWMRFLAKGNESDRIQVQIQDD